MLTWVHLDREFQGPTYPEHGLERGVQVPPLESCPIMLAPQVRALLAKCKGRNNTAHCSTSQSIAHQTGHEKTHQHLTRGDSPKDYGPILYQTLSQISRCANHLGVRWAGGFSYLASLARLRFGELNFLGGPVLC